MGVGKFAFLVHPVRSSDFARKFPVLKYLPDRFVEGVFKHLPPMMVSHITGIQSPTGAIVEGWFIGLPMTPRVILETPWPFVLQRLLRAGRMAESLGAQIFGLGAFTKIVGDRGVSVNEGLDIPVTIGNSYTAATSVEGALLGAERMGIDLKNATVCVIGATGSIGAACSQVIARSVPAVTLVARNRERLDFLAERIRRIGAEPAIFTDARMAVRDADVVIAVSSATETLIEPEDLKPGAVVCDVARPRNISGEVYARRDDVLVMDGGVIEVPGPQVDFGIDFGFPPRMCEACMAETIILALEGRFEPYTLGRDITVQQVEEIHALGRKHGFKVAGFRRFERAISDEEVDRIRENAGRRRRERHHRQAF